MGLWGYWWGCLVVLKRTEGAGERKMLVDAALVQLLDPLVALLPSQIR